MTAPTVNGVRYPQPVDELLPAARTLAEKLGDIPSRNRLMTEFRIGAPKAGELRTRLIEEKARGIATREHEEALRRRMADQFGLTRPDERLGGGLVNEPTPDPWQYAEPIGPDPVPVASGPVSDPVDIPLDAGSGTTPNPGTDPGLTPGADPADPGTGSTPPSVRRPVPTEPDTRTEPAVRAAPEPTQAPEVADEKPQPTPVGHPGTPTPDTPRKPVVVWPIALLAMPAFVAVWSGWVGLGRLTGFGLVDLLPGIVKPGGWATIDSAITLPIGVETYAAYALYVWLSGRVPDRARTFAKWSALGSLLVGALGQIAYHLLVAAGVTSAPWWITTAVACLPVAVLGMGAALAHLVREEN